MGNFHQNLIQPFYILSSLSHLSEIFLGIIFSIVIIIFIAFSIPIYVFRLVVIILAKYIRPDLGDILNAQSSAIVNDYFSGKPPRANVVVTIYIEGKVTLEEIKEGVAEKWIRNRDKETGELKFKNFQQYPVRWLGFTFYKKGFDKFCIENHVFKHKNPSYYVTEKDLTGITETLLNSSFKPEQSLWELYLIENYKKSKHDECQENGEMSVLLFKVHHSLGDGFSILTAIVELFCVQPLSSMQLPLVPKFIQKQSVLQRIMNLIKFPFYVFYEFSYAMSHIFKKSPWKIPDSTKNWHQVLAKSELIPVQDIKLIKDKFKVSFTSVLLSAMSSAIYRTLKEKNTNENVDSMYCMSPLPLPGHSGRLTNHVTGAFFDIPCTKFASSLERLRKVDTMLESFRKSGMPFVVFYYVNLLGWHFYPVCRELFKNRLVSTGLTNFPSLPIKIEKEGRTGVVVDFASGVHEGEAGVGIMVLSYSGNIRIAVTAESAVMSKEEVNQFVNYINDEIENLYQKAVGSQ